MFFATRSLKLIVPSVFVKVVSRPCVCRSCARLFSYIVVFYTSIFSVSVSCSEEWVVDYPLEDRFMLEGLIDVILPAFKENGISLTFQALPNARGLQALSESKYDGSLFRRQEDAEKYSDNYTLISPFLVVLEFVFVERIDPDLPIVVEDIIVTPRNTITSFVNHEEYGKFYYSTDTKSAVKMIASGRFKKALLVKQVALPLIQEYGGAMIYHDPPVARVMMGVVLHNKHSKHFAKISRSLAKSMNRINIR